MRTCIHHNLNETLLFAQDGRNALVAALAHGGCHLHIDEPESDGDEDEGMGLEEG